MLSYHYNYIPCEGNYYCDSYANYESSFKSKPHGLLYRVNESSIAKLDKAEGVKSGHYTRELVTIVTDSGLVRAFTYKAGDLYIQDGVPPTQDYLAHILCGSDLLGNKLSQSVTKALT
jgi:hypothetical protein